MLELLVAFRSRRLFPETGGSDAPALRSLRSSATKYLRPHLTQPSGQEKARENHSKLPIRDNSSWLQQAARSRSPSPDLSFHSETRGGVGAHSCLLVAAFQGLLLGARKSSCHDMGRYGKEYGFYVMVASVVHLRQPSSGSMTCGYCCGQLEQHLLPCCST